MPDISMCENNDCPSAKKCYRHEAKPSSRQTFATFEVPDGKDRCSHFVPVWPSVSKNKPTSEGAHHDGD